MATWDCTHIPNRNCNSDRNYDVRDNKDLRILKHRTIEMHTANCSPRVLNTTLI